MFSDGGAPGRRGVAPAGLHSNGREGVWDEESRNERDSGVGDVLQPDR
jgi:hypothetical protein